MRHNIIWGVAIFFSLWGCSKKEQFIPTMQIKSECNQTHCTPLVQDLLKYPQDIQPYLDEAPDHHKILSIQHHYKKAYYRIWETTYQADPLSRVQWPFDRYTSKNAYGENLQPLPINWFAQMRDASSWQDYGSLALPGVSLQHISLRNFPTGKPLFHDPLQAGEGFPFDYMQNSTVFAEEPLYISHFSKDRSMVYVATSYATGWALARSVTMSGDTSSRRAQPLLAVIKDRISLYGDNKNFLYKGRVGMVLPIRDENATHYRFNAALGKIGTVSKSDARRVPLLFNKANIHHILNQLLSTKYGWGGYYAERDCSSTIRDFFAPFGVWLPRNSYQQSRIGSMINLEGLSPKQKLERIRNNGRAFQTLLYLRGHIMLYVGTYDDTPIVLQTLWGVKIENNEKIGRFIIGKTVLSSLRIGNELPGYQEKNSLLNKLVSMNFPLDSSP